MAADDICPPFWIPVKLEKNPLVAAAANVAIENEYRRTHAGTHLFDSDFDDRLLAIPERAPNTKFARDLIAALRGVSKSRRPDIMDFVSRAYYEIKGAGTYRRHKAACIDQLDSLYRVTKPIRDAYAGSAEPSWQKQNAESWMPPDVLDIDADTKVVTTLSRKSYIDYPGMIVYQVWRRVRICPEEEVAVRATRYTDKDKKLEKLLPPENVLVQQIGRYNPSDPDYVILTPIGLGPLPRLEEAFEKRYAAKTPPAFERRNWPITGAVVSVLDSLSGAAREVAQMLQRHPTACKIMIGVGIVVFVAGAVAIAVAATPELVLAGAALDLTALTTTTGLAGEAAADVAAGQVINLAARRLALEAAKKGLASAGSLAAGTVLIVGTPSSAKAANVEFSEITAMRIVAVSKINGFMGTQAALSSGLSIADPPSVFPTVSEDIEVGDTVLFDSIRYTVAATLSVK